MRIESSKEHRIEFSSFFKASSDEKKRMLYNCGIVLGAEYIGTVTTGGTRVVVKGLINPFNGNKVEGNFSKDNIVLSEGDSVVVRLETMKIRMGEKGLKPSPDNIFVLEYICRLNRDAGGIIRSLKDEIEQYKHEMRRKNAQIEQLTEQRKETIKASDVEYKQELEAKVERLTHKNQELEAVIESMSTSHKDLMEENRRVGSIIIDRGITTLVHVTHVDNLESILEKGIIPRAEVPEGAVTIDPTRSEGKRNCNCLSIERPNNKYFGSHVYDFGGRGKFVCICIKPTILLDEVTKYYCPYNAAINTVYNRIYRGQLTTSDDFQGMFADHINEWGPFAGTIDEYRDQEEPLYLPTSVQAEILYEGIIKPENIVSIDFPSERAKDASQDMLNKYGINGTVNKRLNF